MPPVSIQDRTGEFRAILTDVNKRQLNAKSRSQRQTFSSAPQDSSVNGTLRQRSAFAQQAAGIGKGIVSAPAGTSLLMPVTWLTSSSRIRWRS